MVKNIDYESRRKMILAATINHYIKEAEPVSSEAIAKDFGLSSATIRNVFGELEGAGYLTHPYTSGGRIPTSKGYRYYVDFLVAQMELLEIEKQRIVSEYGSEISELMDVLEKTSEVISAITRYTGIVSILEKEEKLFYKGVSFILDQPEFRSFEKMHFIIRMIEEKQQLLDIINRDFSGNVKIYIGEELDYPGMENCALVVSSYKVKNKPVGRLAVLGPKRMEYPHAITSLEYISGVLTGVLENF